ncbi:MAG: hypothetical protein LIP11_16460 [Clostridiales bacterium]|nr:hypothetical protein [Clostridiales bacterium]
MGYINNRRNSFKRPGENQMTSYREPILCAEEIEGKDPGGQEPEIKKYEEKKPEEKKSGEKKFEDRKSGKKKFENRKSAGNNHVEEKHGQMEFSSIIPVDFSNPTDEMLTERDFRMLQSMYPNEAKELLPFVEEECDRMEYEGSAMFDEYPDFTTVYTVQKKIAAAVAHNRIAAERKEEVAGRRADSVEDVLTDTTGNGMAAAQAEDVCVPLEDLIRVLVLQEMHRRRERYRFCRDKC